MKTKYLSIKIYNNYNFIKRICGAKFIVTPISNVIIN